jgi:uncharacterized RDD family membrane protein YckC
MSFDKDYHEHNDKEVTTETLTAPPLHIRPAPLSKRAGAALIDSVIIGVIWLAIIFTLHPSAPTELGFTVFVLVFVTFLYYFLQEGLISSTIGKRLLRLRVVGRSGDPITLRESFLRNLFRFIDWLPALYALGTCLLVASKGKRRLGDIIAGTTVTLALEKDINPPPAPFLFH